MLKNFPAFHGILNVHCGVHKYLPFVPILAQINPSHALQSYFLKTHLNFTSHLQRGIPSGFPSLRFSHHNPSRIRLLPMCAVYPARPDSFCYYLPNFYLLQSKITLFLFIQFQPSWVKISFPESSF